MCSEHLPFRSSVATLNYSADSSSISNQKRQYAESRDFGRRFGRLRQCPNEPSIYVVHLRSADS